MIHETEKPLQVEEAFLFINKLLFNDEISRAVW